MLQSAVQRSINLEIDLVFVRFFRFPAMVFYESIVLGKFQRMVALLERSSVIPRLKRLPQKRLKRFQEFFVVLCAIKQGWKKASKNKQGRKQT
jgi:hypothetical protein